MTPYQDYLARLSEMSRHLLTRQKPAKVLVPARVSEGEYVREFDRINRLKSAGGSR